MILTYSSPHFVDDILNGVKIHTIRDDKHNRWRPGMSIQHWRGNPRNKSKNPYHFGESRCTGVEKIYIINERGEVWIRVNDRWLTPVEIILLARNDGLNMDEFKARFVPDEGQSFEGRIIHWTSIRYSNTFDVCIFTKEQMLQHYGEKWFFREGLDYFFAEEMYYMLGKIITVKRLGSSGLMDECSSHDVYKSEDGFFIHPYMFSIYR